MEIEDLKSDEKNGPKKLGAYQDTNELDKLYLEYFKKFFLRPFAIYNVNTGTE